MAGKPGGHRVDAIPDDVLAFLDNLKGHIRRSHEAAEYQRANADAGIPEDTSAVQKYLFEEWTKLSEKHFQQNEWPTVGAYKAIVGAESATENSWETFSALYNCLRYYRLYSLRRDQLTYIQRERSWTAFLHFFGTTLADVKAECPVPLPVEWLFALVFSFVDQFQSFCIFRDRASPKADDADIKRDPNVFMAENVMGVLKEVIHCSNIKTVLEKGFPQMRTKKLAGEETLISLGCFAMVGLAKLHLAAGDYNSALMVTKLLVSPTGVAGAGAVSIVVSQLDACHALLKHQIAFAYFMSQRYADAAKVCENALSLVRASGTRTQGKLLKQTEEQLNYLEELIYVVNPLSKLRSKGRKGKMKDLTNIKTLTDLFTGAAPKFINLSKPAEIKGTGVLERTTARRQIDVFVKQADQQRIFASIRKILKMYQTISLSKLASFISPDCPAADRTELMRKHLLCFKKQTGKGVDDVHFFIRKEMVHVQNDAQVAHYGNEFVNQIRQMDSAIRQMQQRRGVILTNNRGGRYRSNRR